MLVWGYFSDVECLDNWTSRCGRTMSAWERIRSEIRRFRRRARAKAFNSNKTSIGRAIAFNCAARCHLSVHSLALPRSGSADDCRGGSTGTTFPSRTQDGTGSTRGGSRRGRCRTSGAANLSEGDGIPVSAPSLAVSAVRGFDDDSLNAFLAATLLRVVRVAVFLLLLFVALIQVF